MLQGKNARAWIPEQGKLILRSRTKPQLRRIGLCYRIGTNPRGFQAIALLDDFRGHAKFHEFTETIEGQTGFNRDGEYVCVDYAQDGDILAFVKLWGDPLTSLSMWLAQLSGSKMKGLRQVELDRIKRMVSKASRER